MSNNFPEKYCSDSITFKGTKAIDLIDKIGRENFPSQEIVKSLENIGESEEYMLRDIHLNYYKDLLSCKTLDEAKEKYPEFKDVIDAKDIDISTLDKRNLLYKIATGDIEDADISTVSLVMLKKYYGKLIYLNNSDQYWGAGNKAMLSMCQSLNIKKMYPRYILTTANQTEETKERMKSRWQNPEFKEKMDEFFQDSKTKQKISERMKKEWQKPERKQTHSEKVKKYWQNPKARQQHSEKLKEHWQDDELRRIYSEKLKELWQTPEYREYFLQKSAEYRQTPEYKESRSKMAKEHWQDAEYKEKMCKIFKEKWKNPEFRKKMAIISKASSEAYNRHPEILEMMREVAKSFPKLGRILNKSGELTDEEKIYQNAYYKACEEAMPGFRKILGEEQKNILHEWKYY